MEKLSLNDQKEFPDDAVLSQHLGDTKKAWDTLTSMINENHPLYTTEWRYYNDGKSWLFKVTKKKKTICWVAVFDKKFKTTFYFSAKAEVLITGSPLKKEYIDQFVSGRRFGKIRAITVEVKKPADLETTELLMEIKEKLK